MSWRNGKEKKKPLLEKYTVFKFLSFRNGFSHKHVVPPIRVALLLFSYQIRS